MSITPPMLVFSPTWKLLKSTPWFVSSQTTPVSTQSLPPRGRCGFTPWFVSAQTTPKLFLGAIIIAPSPSHYPSPLGSASLRWPPAPFFRVRRTKPAGHGSHSANELSSTSHRKYFLPKKYARPMLRRPCWCFHQHEKHRALVGVFTNK